VCIASWDCKSAFTCNYLGSLGIGAIENDVLTDLALRDRQCKFVCRVRLYLDYGKWTRVLSEILAFVLHRG
jgi:hypothetical protein